MACSVSLKDSDSVFVGDDGILKNILGHCLEIIRQLSSEVLKRQ